MPPIALIFDKIHESDREKQNDYFGLGDKNLSSVMKECCSKSSDYINEEKFSLPKRYKYMKMLGNGAYGLVWYLLFLC